MRRTRSIHSSRLRSNAIPCEIVNTFSAAAAEKTVFHETDSLVWMEMDE